MALNAPQVAELRHFERIEQAATARALHRAAAFTRATAASATSAPGHTVLRKVAKSALVRVAVYTAVLVVAAAVWVIRHDKPYLSGTGLGYLLGLTGGSLMFVLSLYPLRKRIRFTHTWAPLKYWFKFHMAAGIIGPVLVVFHSAFRVNSFNAAIALASMLLVVLSGLVGRIFYRKVHHGLYGAHATIQDLQQEMTQALQSLEPLLERMPAVRREVDRFAALASNRPQGWKQRAWHFVSFGAKRIAVRRALRRTIASYLAAGAAPAHAHAPASFASLVQTVDATLHAVQRAGQFSAYERLLSLWHAVHIPFLCMLLITAVVHVVAVHAY